MTQIFDIKGGARIFFHWCHNFNSSAHLMFESGFMVQFTIDFFQNSVKGSLSDRTFFYEIMYWTSCKKHTQRIKNHMFLNIRSACVYKYYVESVSTAINIHNLKVHTDITKFQGISRCLQHFYQWYQKHFGHQLLQSK